MSKQSKSKGFRVIVHELKIDPEYFNAVICGDKTFEFRNNERDFKKGDAVILKEYCKEIRKYTGREATVSIKYVLTCIDFDEMPDGWCIFSFRIIDYIATHEL